MERFKSILDKINPFSKSPDYNDVHRNTLKLTGYPSILELTLNGGDKHEIPIYVDRTKKGPSIYIPHVNPKDVEAIKQIDQSISPTIIINEYDNAFRNDIRFMDSLNGEDVKMIDESELLFSKRFLLSLNRATERDSNIKMIVGPLSKDD